MIDQNMTVRVLSLFFTCFCSTCLLGQQQDSSQTIRGVEVTFELDDKMFPQYWVKAPISITAKPIATKEKERCLKIAKMALEKYPQSVLQENIKTIYFVRKLNFSGIGAGGTYYQDRVYLANNGAALGYTDKYMESSFHHEFSSILFANHRQKLETKAWKSANLSDFEYGKSGTQAVKDGKDSLHFETKLAERGFINEYGQSTLEEDFNTIASELFTSDKSFWRAYEKHERLKQKIDIAIEFYAQISPTFNKSFFENLSH